MLLRDLWRKAIYLYSLTFQNELKGLNVANVPQKALLASCTSVDDVHGDGAGNTKTSNDAGDDATKDDSLHHVLLPPFMINVDIT